MKRIMFTSVLLLAVAAGVTASVTDKRKGKQKKADNTEMSCCQQAQQEPVKIVTGTDSTSFAAGYAATDGLMPYLQQQVRIDSAHMADFIRGYEMVASKRNDPAVVAFLTGTNIAGQVLERLLPSLNSPFADTPDTLNTKLFHQGFLAGVTGDSTLFTLATSREFFEAKAEAATEKKLAPYREENEAWLKENAKKDSVVTLPSGLQYKILKQGNGSVPAADDEVEVVYEGRTIDGNVFDATSRHGGETATKFRCNQVIKGWTQALTMMPVGSKWEVYIPQELAYGSQSAGRIKPYSTLIFTMELKGITSKK